MLSLRVQKKTKNKQTKEHGRKFPQYMDNSRPTGEKKFAYKLSIVWFSVKKRLKMLYSKCLEILSV
jgi:hypothetical protein